MASIRKRGNLQWEARVRRKGHPIQCKTFEAKVDAEKWARMVEKEMDGGSFISQKEAKRTTVREALERFIPEYIERNLAHAHKETVRAKRVMEYPFAQKALAALRGSDLSAFIHEREQQGRSPHTISRDIALISRLYEVARSNWGMEGLHNPAKSIIRPKLPPGRTRRLRKGEEERLLEKSPRNFQDVMKFALETAMRRGEIAALTWECLDLERGTAHLPKTKNGEERTVPLSPKAIGILKSRLAMQSTKEKVFCYTEDSITATMRAACATAEISDLRFHDLRHEATSRLFENTDLDIMEIRMITGHKTLQMLANYTHLRADRLVKRLAGKTRKSS